MNHIAMATDRGGQGSRIGLFTLSGVPNHSNHVTTSTNNTTYLMKLPLPVIPEHICDSPDRNNDENNPHPDSVSSEDVEMGKLGIMPKPKQELSNGINRALRVGTRKGDSKEREEESLPQYLPSSRQPATNNFSCSSSSGHNIEIVMTARLADLNRVKSTSASTSAMANEMNATMAKHEVGIREYANGNGDDAVSDMVSISTGVMHEFEEALELVKLVSLTEGLLAPSMATGGGDGGGRGGGVGEAHFNMGDYRREGGGNGGNGNGTGDNDNDGGVGGTGTGGATMYQSQLTEQVWEPDDGSIVSSMTSHSRPHPQSHSHPVILSLMKQTVASPLPAHL